MTEHQNEPEVGGIAADRLRSIIERIERLNEERAGIANDIKDIFQEAKSNGFDVVVLRRIIKARSKRPEDIDEEDAVFDTYRHALGM